MKTLADHLSRGFLYFLKTFHEKYKDLSKDEARRLAAPIYIHMSDAEKRKCLKEYKLRKWKRAPSFLCFATKSMKSRRNPQTEIDRLCPKPFRTIKNSNQLNSYKRKSERRTQRRLKVEQYKGFMNVVKPRQEIPNSHGPCYKEWRWLPYRGRTVDRRFVTEPALPKMATRKRKEEMKPRYH